MTKICVGSMALVVEKACMVFSKVQETCKLLRQVTSNDTTVMHVYTNYMSTCAVMKDNTNIAVMSATSQCSNFVPYSYQTSNQLVLQDNSYPSLPATREKSRQPIQLLIIDLGMTLSNFLNFFFRTFSFAKLSLIVRSHMSYMSKIRVS